MYSESFLMQKAPTNSLKHRNDLDDWCTLYLLVYLWGLYKSDHNDQSFKFYFSVPDEAMTFLVSTILQLAPKSGIVKDEVDHPNLQSTSHGHGDSNVLVTEPPVMHKDTSCCA